MAVSIQDYEEVHREVQDIARRYMELDYEGRKRLGPKLKELRDAFVKLRTILGEQEPAMNWYTGERR